MCMVLTMILQSHTEQSVCCFIIRYLGKSADHFTCSRSSVNMPHSSCHCRCAVLIKLSLNWICSSDWNEPRNKLCMAVLATFQISLSTLFIIGQSAGVTDKYSYHFFLNSASYTTKSSLFLVEFFPRDCCHPLYSRRIVRSEEQLVIQYLKQPFLMCQFLQSVSAGYLTINPHRGAGSFTKYPKTLVRRIYALAVSTPLVHTTLAELRSACLYQLNS